MRETLEDHDRLVRLIRKVAKEEAYAVLDEHLEDFEHEEKPVPEMEISGAETD